MAKQVYGHITIDGRGVQMNLAADQADFDDHFPECDEAGLIDSALAREAVSNLDGHLREQWVTSRALMELGFAD